MDGQKIMTQELPTGENRIFTESTSFKKDQGDLPSPDQIRQRDIETNGIRARCERPPVVVFKEQKLVVKYGSFITTAEAQCLWYFNRYMKDHVPTPELYGWCQDAGETFIYMELISGETLKEAWPSMTEEEQDIVCRELRECVAAWRRLRQEKEPYYIGKQGAT
ncbi:hypothetical protein KJ359_012105 [Pestalotiopsis sp. 9143b]|nr:hypothetical protein KJ359_012105 [Pestalotiopsis sp. 9143b]